MDVLRLAAFTEDPAGGNPAGVVLADALPTPGRMQEIAADVGYSETAFVAPAGERRWRVRYFSPTVEVPFCGHATIATGVVLGDRDGPGRHLLDLNHATVPVVVADRDGRPHATLTSPAASSAPVDDDVLDAALRHLRWSRADLDPGFPPAEAHAGAGHLLLVLRKRWMLADLRYDYDALAELARERDWVTVHCTWRESDRRWHARGAAPAIGVREDPATGAAAAAFGGYLRDAVGASPPFGFVIRQGEDMGRPSTIEVEVDADDPGVRVTGTAVEIPAPADA